MLCQFSVKNFRSIKDTVVLDMQTASIKEHVDTVLQCQDGETFLPVAVLYGPNGGGKSNVLHAIHALWAVVLKPSHLIQGDRQEEYNTNSIVPFKFSKETQKQPTEFEIFFRTDSAEYRYVLHIQDKKVIYESLDRIKFETNRPSSLFKKDNNQIILKGDLEKLKISEDLSEDIPLLSYLALTYKKNVVIKEVIDWFDNKLCVINYGNFIHEKLMFINQSHEYKDLVLKMFKELDIDIVDFRMEEENDKIKDIYTTHVVGDYTNELSLKDESNGTRKLFGFIPRIINALQEGKVLVVDELDAKIHPMLLKYIVNLFTDSTINKQHAQLIMTSHDLSILNNKVLRRDEIWFVAKGNEQNSVLYSLVEFKGENNKTPRNDAKYDKQYLEGKYGADPYLKKIIDWGNHNEYLEEST